LNKQVIAYGQPDDVFKPELLKQAYGGRIGVFQVGNEAVLVADEHVVN
jgi:hypothetical protein